jgi:ribosomal RNA-processing protein 1
MPFLAAFWKTMAREWTGIDVLRMDKFLYLIRQYLHSSFQHISSQDWSHTKLIDACMEVIQSTPLNTDDPKIPDGLRYHVIDIYVDELDKVGGDDAELPADRVLAPLERLGKESRNNKIRERVREAMDDERVRKWRGETSPANGLAADDDDEGEWGGIEG